MKSEDLQYGDRCRWVLLTVLSCITIINYIDRQAVSILYPAITQELHLPAQTYTLLVTYFLIAYTTMYAIGGYLVDRVGTRNGLTIALTWWSVATILTGTAQNAFWLELFRVMLAIGQPMVFSAGIKACAEFFLAHQRALATGIFSAGSGVGALVATPALGAITLYAGWQWAMVTPGLVGLVLAPLWIWAYNRTKKLPLGPRQLVPTQSWWQLLRQRRTWALVLPRAIGDPLWYFCFFWIPVYLQQARHLDLKQLVLVGWMPFMFADLGSVLGGSISDALIRRGLRPVRARLAVLACCAGAAPLGGLIGFVPSIQIAILLLALLAFVSQCWTTTTSALAADIFPGSSMGAIAGMMGTAGGLGAAAFSQMTGTVIVSIGYGSAFVLVALLLPIAAGLLVLLLRADHGRTLAQTQSVA
jgi:MFS transporter, ACS family, hexuronate transporter